MEMDGGAATAAVPKLNVTGGSTTTAGSFELPDADPNASPSDEGAVDTPAGPIGLPNVKPPAAESAALAGNDAHADEDEGAVPVPNVNFAPFPFPPPPLAPNADAVDAAAGTAVGFFPPHAAQLAIS